MRKRRNKSDWKTRAKDYELLAEIHGAAKYLSNTGHNYVTPSQPPYMNSDMLIPGKTQMKIKIIQSMTIVAKHNYAGVMGFTRGSVRTFVTHSDCNTTSR